MTIAKIKEQIPLRDYVEQTLGEPRYRYSSYDAHECPWCGGDNSLLVYTNSCKCLAGCQINGKDYGDLIDFAAEMGRTDAAGAVEALSSGISHALPQRVLQRAVARPKYVVGMKEVMQAASRWEETVPYFSARGLRENTISDRKLGVRISGNTVRINGVERKFYAERYTIPCVGLGLLRYMTQRLNETDAATRIGAMDTETLESAIRELKKKKKYQDREIGIKEIAYFLFGDRYKTLYSAVPGSIFNLDRLMNRTPDGDLVFYRLPYILIHEGEIKAYATEDGTPDSEYGYPSIGNRGGGNLQQAILNVKQVFVVKDNEPDKILENGKRVNPGEEHAHAVIKASGRVLGQAIQIIVPPKDLKAADDVKKAGFLSDWLSSYGIEPVKLRKPEDRR